MRIGELASRSGTLAETIRYYERIGVVPAPPRNVSGYRQYRPEHLHRLIFVRRCRELGFSIVEIKSLLQLAHVRDQSCSNVTRIAADHLKDVRIKLAQLKRLDRALQSLVKCCAGGPMQDCKILEALIKKQA